MRPENAFQLIIGGLPFCLCLVYYRAISYSFERETFTFKKSIMKFVFYVFIPILISTIYSGLQDFSDAIIFLLLMVIGNLMSFYDLRKQYKKYINRHKF